MNKYSRGTRPPVIRGIRLGAPQQLPKVGQAKMAGYGGKRDDKLETSGKCDMGDVRKDEHRNKRRNPKSRSRRLDRQHATDG